MDAHSFTDRDASGRHCGLAFTRREGICSNCGVLRCIALSPECPAMYNSEEKIAAIRINKRPLVKTDPEMASGWHYETVCPLRCGWQMRATSYVSALHLSFAEYELDVTTYGEEDSKTIWMTHPDSGDRNLAETNKTARNIIEQHLAVCGSVK